MMEKYGVEQSTYEVVVPVPGKPDDFTVIGSYLSLEDATKLQQKNPKSIVRPE
jgi:hypothetical protein